MRVGIFSDTHDHLDNIRRAVAVFNELNCECVLFAGDLVSTFAIPPLRQLKCKLYGCFGDNEGNRVGILGGMKIIGELREAPAEFRLADGTRVVVVHMKRQLQGYLGDFDVAVFGHTHRPSVERDDRQRLFVNPGETSGWTYGSPTVGILETTTGCVEILPLDTSVPLRSWDEERRLNSRRKDGTE
ncbi:metallophosphoesterase [Planctomicrobium sp. SH668]|uniref:metallophosphoesterase n=1 Tax=Planctomicrobium sp. SH668 TaxID=3448126 RepID=UPI003F5C696A